MRMCPAHPVLPPPFQRWPTQLVEGRPGLSAPAPGALEQLQADPTAGLRPEQIRFLHACSPSISYRSASGRTKYLSKHLLLWFDERPPLLCSMGPVAPQDQNAAEAAGIAYCAGQGAVFCAPKMDSPAWIRIRNLQFLWSFYVREDAKHQRHCQDILDYVAQGGPMSLHEAAQVLADVLGLLERVEPVWWTMVAHGILQCDLDRYLTALTVCSFNEAFRGHCVAEDEYWTSAPFEQIAKSHQPHQLREARELNHERLRTMERHSHWLTLTRLQNDRLVNVEMRKCMPTSYHGVSVTSLAGATLEPEFDCPLQRDLVSRLMFDHQVTVEKEPASVYYERPNGNMGILRFDLLIHFKDRPSIYCVVPNPARPLTRFELDAKQAEGVAFAKRENCHFDIFDETRIRTQRLRNIQFLWEYLMAEDLDIEDPLYDRVMEAASSVKSGTRQEILKNHTHQALDRDHPETYRNAHRLEAAWWTLVFHKILRCNLDEPLTDSTVYSLDEWERERRSERHAAIAGEASRASINSMRRRERATRAQRRLQLGGPI